MTYKELIEHGDNFHTYVGLGTQSERNDVAEFITTLENSNSLTSSTLDQLSLIKEDCYLLVAAEMWCPDCRINVSVMNKLCELQPKLRLSVISKGRAEDKIMDRLGLNQILLPVVAVLNSKYEVIGKFIELPSVVCNQEENETVKNKYAKGMYMDDTAREIINQII